MLEFLDSLYSIVSIKIALQAAVVSFPLPYSLKSSVASATCFIEDSDSLVYPAIVSKVPPCEEIQLKW